MTRTDPSLLRAAIGRRAVLAGAVAASFAASPAGACSLTLTPRRPASFYSDQRARAQIEAYLAAANKGEAAGAEELAALPGIEIFGERQSFAADYAGEWLVSSGRRDDRPARLEHMVPLSRGRRQALFLVGIDRSMYFPADEGDSCFGPTSAGHYQRHEAWLFHFRPDSSSSLRLLTGLGVEEVTPA